MARSMMEPREKVFTGWHMLAIMIAFFGVVISVNILMAWYATSTWSGLVVQNSYVASQEFNEKAAEARALTGSGIRTTVTADGQSVRYRLLAADGTPLAGVTRVHVDLRRPVESHEDLSFDLTPRGDGLYTATLAIKSGQWIADIDTTGVDETGTTRRLYREAVRLIVTGAQP
ncbi:Nitrogen fixation protein FixH [Rhizobium sp. RU20A]|uniref:FixH family protein n=1 Tax=Rhizobium sp. RU20A TaxID=1907412 RepID=UPI000954FFFA|nr:FixH family protein [Rhizobium sp. RU20A]SIQ15431.1 Nitrogen fixation protein FixH [Rhizobium sp. RU20A]